MRHAIKLLEAEARRLRANAAQHRQYRGAGDGSDLMDPETEARDYERRARQCERAVALLKAHKEAAK